ncbi:MAG: hypothetical protein ACXIUM_06560 [Wenzhouxiangella sp.]
MLINTDGTNGQELFPISQTFSESRQYKADLTHPGSRRYFITVDGATVGELSLGIGLGALGADLVSWVFDKAFVDLVNSEFKLFVKEFERLGYEIIRCDEVGYQGPIRIVPADNITSEVESDRTDAGGAADSS